MLKPRHSSTSGSVIRSKQRHQRSRCWQPLGAGLTLKRTSPRFPAVPISAVPYLSFWGLLFKGKRLPHFMFYLKNRTRKTRLMISTHALPHEKPTPRVYFPGLFISKCQALCPPPPLCQSAPILMSHRHFKVPPWLHWESHYGFRFSFESPSFMLSSGKAVQCVETASRIPNPHGGPPLPSLSGKVYCNLQPPWGPTVHSPAGTLDRNRAHLCLLFSTPWQSSSEIKDCCCTQMPCYSFLLSASSCRY